MRTAGLKLVANVSAARDCYGQLRELAENLAMVIGALVRVASWIVLEFANKSHSQAKPVGQLKTGKRYSDFVAIGKYVSKVVVLGSCISASFFERIFLTASAWQLKEANSYRAYRLGSTQS